MRAAVWGLALVLLMSVAVLSVGCAAVQPLGRASAEDPKQDCAKRHGRLLRSKSGGAVCVPEDED